MEIEDEDNTYVWEKKYVGAWEKIEEEIVESREKEIHEQRKKREKLLDRVNNIVERGVIRSHGLTIRDHDFQSKRVVLIESSTKSFVKEYFDQNPICQMGLIISRNGIAEKISDLTGNPKKILKAVDELPKFGGDASMQNSLEIAYESFQSVPVYGTKEILILYSALSSIDPSDIFETIKKLKKAKIRCSIVGLGSEIYVGKYLSKETDGTYSIPLTEENYRELILQHAIPPPSKKGSKINPSLISMGFPQKRPDTLNAMCICHKDITPGGYLCPRCSSKHCQLPVDCEICKLSLVSSPHLARSYHHLFPVKSYKEIEPETNMNCASCQKYLIKGNSLFLQCPDCSGVFCFDCDQFIHDSLHNCPTCE
eukprot:gene544-8056_t